MLHPSYPQLDDYVAKWEPPSSQNFMAQSAFRWMALGHSEIADMITSLICHGTLTRFPRLRIASVENGRRQLATIHGAADRQPGPAAVKPPAMANA